MEKGPPRGISEPLREHQASDGDEGGGRTDVREEALEVAVSTASSLCQAL